tara:strand:+ start:2180 stop:2599 length:420 start_codon:yes stop_codon:yes gene_type:complete
MDLYTDGTTKATTDEITTALTESQADDTAAREATATELQTWIDGYYDGREWDYVAEDWKADPADFDGDKTLKLKAASVTAIADTIDDAAVAVQLPDDADGQPKFWSGQAASIGEDLGANKARTRKDKMRIELARISALL